MGVSEVDRQVNGEGEGGMLGHLGALIPGQRPAQVHGQPVHRAGQGVLHRGGGVTGRSATGHR